MLYTSLSVCAWCISNISTVLTACVDHLSQPGHPLLQLKERGYLKGVFSLHVGRDGRDSELVILGATIRLRSHRDRFVTDE